MHHESKWNKIDGVWLRTGLQRSGGASLSSPEEPAALQNLWEQTKATGGQKTGAIALGAANIVGLSILATWPGGLSALAGSNLAFMINLVPFLGVRSLLLPNHPPPPSHPFIISLR